MVHVVALGAGGGHDGGVGDRGAVVAADGAGHTGGDADDGHGVVHLKHALNNGDQDAEGAPAGAGGEGQEAAHHEHDHRQEHLQTGGGAHKIPDKEFRAQGVGHALEGPGEGEDQDGGDHGLESLGDTAHHLLEGHGLADKIVVKGEEQAESGAQHQAHRGVGVGEGGDKISPGEEAAGVDHTDDAGHDQHQNGQYQVQYRALGLVHVVVQHGVGVRAGEQVALLNGVPLIPGHGAELHLHQHHADHHGDGEQGVEVIGDGADEQVEALAVLGEAGHGGGPGGDGGDDADGGGGGVDEVGQLGPGDILFVGDGPHDGAHGEAVKIVVNEDQTAQQDGGQLSPGPGFDVLLGPAAEGGGAARLVHQAHHGAQNDQEDQDSHVVAVGQRGHDTVAEGVEYGALKGEVGVEQSAHQNTDEQGGINLLGNQGQGDGDHRGQQGHGGVVKITGGHNISHILAVAAGLAGDGLALVGQNHTHSGAVGALDVLGAAELGGVLHAGKGGADHGQQQHRQKDDPQA